MNRQDKEKVVSSLKEDFARGSSFIVQYKGLNVEQITRLRNNVRQSGGRLRVAKIALMKRALRDTVAENLLPYIKDQVALVFVDKQSIDVAKILNDFAKNNEELGIVGGWAFDKVLDGEAVRLLALLPPREVLLAQLCCVLNAPIVKFVHTLQEMIVQPIHIVQQIKEKKS